MESSFDEWVQKLEEGRRNAVTLSLLRALENGCSLSDDDDIAAVLHVISDASAADRFVPFVQRWAGSKNLYVQSAVLSAIGNGKELDPFFASVQTLSLSPYGNIRKKALGVIGKFGVADRFSECIREGLNFKGDSSVQCAALRAIGDSKAALEFPECVSRFLRSDSEEISLQYTAFGAVGASRAASAFRERIIWGLESQESAVQNAALDAIGASEATNDFMVPIQKLIASSSVDSLDVLKRTVVDRKTALLFSSSLRDILKSDIPRDRLHCILFLQNVSAVKSFSAEIQTIAQRDKDGVVRDHARFVLTQADIPLPPSGLSRVCHSVGDFFKGLIRKDSSLEALRKGPPPLEKTAENNPSPKP